MTGRCELDVSKGTGVKGTCLTLDWTFTKSKDFRENWHKFEQKQPIGYDKQDTLEKFAMLIERQDQKMKSKIRESIQEVMKSN